MVFGRGGLAPVVIVGRAGTQARAMVASQVELPLPCVPAGGVGAVALHFACVGRMLPWPYSIGGMKPRLLNGFRKASTVSLRTEWICRTRQVSGKNSDTMVAFPPSNSCPPRASIPDAWRTACPSFALSHSLSDMN